MHWLKLSNGDLINLAQAAYVSCQDGEPMRVDMCDGEFATINSVDAAHILAAIEGKTAASAPSGALAQAAAVLCAELANIKDDHKILSESLEDARGEHKWLSAYRVTAACLGHAVKVIERNAACINRAVEILATESAPAPDNAVLWQVDNVLREGLRAAAECSTFGGGYCTARAAIESALCLLAPHLPSEAKP